MIRISSQPWPRWALGACVLQQRQGLSTGLASSVSSSKTATLSLGACACSSGGMAFWQGGPARERAGVRARAAARKFTWVSVRAAAWKFACVPVRGTPETRHLDWLRQLSEFERDSSTGSEQESNTDSHNAHRWLNKLWRNPAKRERKAKSRARSKQIPQQPIQNSTRAEHGISTGLASSGTARHLDRLGQLGVVRAGDLQQHRHECRARAPCTLWDLGANRATLTLIQLPGCLTNPHTALELASSATEGRGWEHPAQPEQGRLVGRGRRHKSPRSAAAGAADGVTTTSDTRAGSCGACGATPEGLRRGSTFAIRRGSASNGATQGSGAPEKAPFSGCVTTS